MPTNAARLLTIDDAAAAAENLAFLLLGAPLDHAMCHEAAPPLDGNQIAHRAGRSVRVFLAAYRVGSPAVG